VQSRELIEIVTGHVHRFFSGHEISEHRWELGPLPDHIPEFRVLCVAPDRGDGNWVLVSAGASAIVHESDPRYEFVMVAPSGVMRCVELLTMLAWYHKTERVGIGHTLPLGEPWLGDSSCNHLLLRAADLFGHELALCPCGDGHVHLAWALPITQAERDYEATYGREALERKFDDAVIPYWDAHRASVV